MEMRLVDLFVLLISLIGNIEAQGTCGTVDETLEDFQVRMFSVADPTGFEADLSCSWTLRAVNTESTIGYQLSDIDLGPDDFINVFAGTSTADTSVVTDLTAVGLTQDVSRVNTPNILVTFDSGSVEQTTPQNFDLFFIAGSDRSGDVSCLNQELTATADPQVLTSPSFPGKYPESSQCNWTITAPESATLNLTFSFIDIEPGDSPTTCEFDKLEVYLPGQRDNPELLVCRRNVWVAETHEIASNQVELQFTGDDSDSFGGFVLTYTAILPPTTTTTTTTTTTEAPTTPTSQPTDACGLPLVTGPCRGIFKKYGYDTVSKTCKEFIYGGCGGNGNQFDSVEMCEKQCKPMDSCDVVSCIIPIVVIVVIIIIAVIVAVILVQKRRRNSSKKYTPTAAGEPSDASELKKMSPEPENV